MDIQQLVPVDYSNQRVLLTAQVAEVFGTTTERISHNFCENKQHFKEGEHFFKLTGAALRSFKKDWDFSTFAARPLSSDTESFRSPAAPFSRMANCLYLWTEQGTMLHCKMVNTDEAWKFMANLQSNYFAVNKPALVPQVFNHPQFGNLRIVIINGEVWFVGKDVAEGLGYKDTVNALKQHVDDADKMGWQITTPSRGVQKITVINKSGVYSLILDSQMPKAKEYRHWVTSEILPQVDEKGYYVKESVETSLFPDEPVTAKKKRRPLPEFAVVYSALLDNALVKIGLTTDFNRRIKEVRKETGQDVEDVFTTGNLPLDDARKLEATVKAKFHDKNKGGELYDAPFEQVKAAIDKHDDKFDKLLALADRLPDSEEKTRLVLQAASLV